MHNRFDRFAKDLLTEVFDTFGSTRTEVEVAADPQRADVCFLPDPDHKRGPPELSLFARIAAGPCIIEPYSEPPSPDEMRGCVRKQLGWHHVRSSQAERARSTPEASSAKLEFPSLWVLSTGHPRRVMAGFGLSPGDAWPAGVYTGPIRDIPFWLVVLNELPEERGTLLLRLLGRGATQRRAFRELNALPSHAWEHAHAERLLVELSIEATKAPLGQLAAEDEELIVNAQEFVQSIKNEARQQGLQPLIHQFERKLGRSLTDDEGAIIQQRLETVGPNRLGDVAMDFDAEALAAWLTDTAAR